MRQIKLRGLNKRQVSVNYLRVMFLEEAELDGNLITNIHFDNGKWVTVAYSLDEVDSLLFPGEEARESEEDKKQLERWKRQAIARREADKEIDAAMRECGLKGKVKSWSSETVGNMQKITIDIENPEKLED